MAVGKKTSSCQWAVLGQIKRKDGSRMPERHFRNLRSRAKPWKRKAAAKMRRNLTWPEKILWARLKDGKLGVNCYKQSILCGYIADVWIPKPALCIEIDGPSHAKQVTYDKIRDHALWKKGIVTMRFSNQEVVNNPAAVVALIEEKMKKRMK